VEGSLIDESAAPRYPCLTDILWSCEMKHATNIHMNRLQYIGWDFIHPIVGELEALDLSALHCTNYLNASKRENYTWIRSIGEAKIRIDENEPSSSGEVKSSFVGEEENSSGSDDNDDLPF
jgi:hypothetical protein